MTDPRVIAIGLLMVAAVLLKIIAATVQEKE